MSTRSGCGPQAIGYRKTAGHGAQDRSSLRAGFTLVELLVAVTLVVLIMTMFAQVFRTASNLISRQKGMAENGQRARTLTTIIQNDIQRRTFRHVEPWEPTETTPANDDADNRQGYFYYSENTVGSDANNKLSEVDDVLQFTIRIDETERPLSGKATLVGSPTTDLNQPEGDDGQIFFDSANMDAKTLVPNGLGASRWAEVSYFVRNAVLYRRVMLIREPYDSSSGPLPMGIIDGSAPYPGANSFWNDFDYSAYYNGTGPAFADYQLSLDNTAGPAAATSSLGAPFHRFGHYHEFGAAHLNKGGNPREYADPTAGADPATGAGFIGRFTHQETSHPLFGYPGVLNDLNGDMVGDDPANPDLPLSVVNGVVNVPYTDGAVGGGDDVALDGPRVAEDILLTNVQAFDVKIWDPTVQPVPGFVDLGNNLATGTFRKANDHHAAPPPPLSGTPIIYGPRSTAGNVDNRVFDTWHPQLDLDGDGTNDYAPYSALDPDPMVARALRLGRDGQPGVAGLDDDGANGIDDDGEIGWPGTDDNRLKAIQITIRFFDVSSNQMKQITLMESLTNIVDTTEK